MDISKIDKNFSVNTQIKREGQCFYDIEQQPFAVYGVQIDDGRYRRLPESIEKDTSEGVLQLHTNTAGGRVRFVTDSPYIAISAKMDSLGKMPHFPLPPASGWIFIPTKNIWERMYLPLQQPTVLRGV